MNKILMIEPSTAIRQLLSQYLKELDIQSEDLLQVATGEEGLGCFETHRIGMVILDWSLPDGHPLNIVKTIREKDTQVPIILLTPEIQRTKVMMAVRAGVTHILTKPFMKKDLLGKVKALTGV